MHCTREILELFAEGIKEPFSPHTIADGVSVQHRLVTFGPEPDE